MYSVFSYTFSSINLNLIKLLFCTSLFSSNLLINCEKSSFHLLDHHRSLEHLNNEIYNRLLAVEEKQKFVFRRKTNKQINNNLNNNKLSSLDLTRSNLNASQFNTNLNVSIYKSPENSSLFTQSNSPIHHQSGNFVSEFDLPQAKHSNLTLNLFTLLENQFNLPINRTLPNYKSNSIKSDNLSTNFQHVTLSKQIQFQSLIYKKNEKQSSSNCASNKDCAHKCDTSLGLCYCPPEYISQRNFRDTPEQVNWPPSHCYLAKSLNQNCIYDEQCIIKHSKCTRSMDNQELRCLCMLAYAEKEHEHTVKYGSFQMKVKSSCHKAPTQTQLSFFLLLTMGTIFFAFCIIGCVLIMFKLRKRKQRPYTMTTLVNNNQNLALNQQNGTNLDPNSVQYLNSVPGNNSLQAQQGNLLMPNSIELQPGSVSSQQMMMLMQQQPHQQNQPHQHPAFRMAPIGSAEAEFQNDFIAVFPMHHLEPCPEKNTTSALMNLEKSFFNS